jgi:hypothetical protein
MMKSFILFQLIFASTGLAAETPLIDLDRVTHSMKKRFLKIGANEFTSTNQFTISCNEDFDFVKEEFNFNHMEFEINENIEKVWQTYMNIDVKESWNGKSIKFDFAYSKPLDEVYYRDSATTPKLHIGMGVFLILDVYGVKKIPTSMEVSKLDLEHKSFEYTYLTQNTSHGRQSVYFIDLGNNKTKMVHDTYFKSGQSLRDKLYPPIHEDLIEEFHQNILARSQITIKRTK